MTRGTNATSNQAHMPTCSNENPILGAESRYVDVGVPSCRTMNSQTPSNGILVHRQGNVPHWWPNEVAKRRRMTIQQDICSWHCGVTSHSVQPIIKTQILGITSIGAQSLKCSLAHSQNAFHHAQSFNANLSQKVLSHSIAANQFAK